jgi:hypothetical protein
MQAAISIRLPHVRDGLIVANVGGCSYQNKVVILSAARSAQSKDLRFSSSHRRIC